MVKDENYVINMINASIISAKRIKDDLFPKVKGDWGTLNDIREELLNINSYLQDAKDNIKKYHKNEVETE